MGSKLSADLLEAIDKLEGGAHPGFRPFHAKGYMYNGTFAPAADARGLTRAPHASRPSTPVLVRFSGSSGLPTVAENDAQGAAPQGMAMRFFLDEKTHAHTDIIAHSHNGFPTRTGEEFLEFLRAAAASGPGAANPPPIAAFLAAHPATKAFVEAPKSIPSSFARQEYFAINAFKFTNAQGQSRFGRFRIRPEAGTEFLSAEALQKKTADFLGAGLSERLSKGPVKFRVLVQLAEAGDPVTDATAVWPESRTLAEIGTLSVTERVDEFVPWRRMLIYDPVPKVDGIESAGDPITDVRSDLYLMSGLRRRAAAGLAAPPKSAKK
jgi:catalase